MAVAARQFFNHIDAFVDYRKTIYETSDQTVRSNCIDLNLFREFVKERKANCIDGPTVMSFQYHLKKQRNNSGPSINRKIFTLRSYGHLLKLQDVEEAWKLPFYDVLKVRAVTGKSPTPSHISKLRSFSKASTVQPSSAFGTMPAMP